MSILSNRPRSRLATAAFAALLASSVAMAATPALAKWDSIAVDDSPGVAAGDAGYGVGTGDTRAEAQHQAKLSCKSEGNDGCTIEVTYEDVCGAYASSRKFAGHGIGQTKVDARKAALDACGDDACKVLVVDCVERD